MVRGSRFIIRDSGREFLLMHTGGGSEPSCNHTGHHYPCEPCEKGGRGDATYLIFYPQARTWIDPEYVLEGVEVHGVEV